LENNFDDLEHLHILYGGNEVADELAKLRSNQTKVPQRVFMQEHHEPSIVQAMSKASKVVESSQKTTSPVEDKYESPDVMTVHSNWCTPFMIYLKIGGLPDDKDERERVR
jgi:hypothetical protein